MKMSKMPRQKNPKPGEVGLLALRARMRVFMSGILLRFARVHEISGPGAEG
jgi:hypothetical protein